MIFDTIARNKLRKKRYQHRSHPPTENQKQDPEPHPHTQCSKNPDTPSVIPDTTPTCRGQHIASTQGDEAGTGLCIIISTLLQNTGRLVPFAALKNQGPFQKIGIPPQRKGDAPFKATHQRAPRATTMCDTAPHPEQNRYNTFDMKP